MAERPILFSAPMVRALLNGSKTQTRRVVKPQPHHGPVGQMVNLGDADWAMDDGDLSGQWRCPYGVAGDRLWVKETYSGPHALRELPPREWLVGAPFQPGIWYWADGNPTDGDWTRPKPSIHMPRWASRITLQITDVRVERLQDISEEDAVAEGVCGSGDPEVWPPCAKAAYLDLWDEINGADEAKAWVSNPWVWVVAFERVPS